ncbi:hypothetical protein CEXT_5401 [Caerostris extrusa]|uniref:Uncharacterized protein n=1 Tax=Caerostris extrusa TaxID=172846 RepID=A0AAV4S816_CAEEX|nr:hypothetical protein CEXT_5401 [Caerostris extrusa]
MELLKYQKCDHVVIITFEVTQYVEVQIIPKYLFSMTASRSKIKSIQVKDANQIDGGSKGFYSSWQTRFPKSVKIYCTLYMLGVFGLSLYIQERERERVNRSFGKYGFIEDM